MPQSTKRPKWSFLAFSQQTKASSGFKSAPEFKFDDANRSLEISTESIGSMSYQEGFIVQRRAETQYFNTSDGDFRVPQPVEMIAWDNARDRRDVRAVESMMEKYPKIQSVKIIRRYQYMGMT